MVDYDLSPLTDDLWPELWTGLPQIDSRDLGRPSKEPRIPVPC